MTPWPDHNTEAHSLLRQRQAQLAAKALKEAGALPGLPGDDLKASAIAAEKLAALLTLEQGFQGQCPACDMTFHRSRHWRMIDGVPVRGSDY
jgi:hypothetical protein